MLLVDDDEGEVLEFHIFLEQRMGADQQIDVAEREPVEDFLADCASLRST